jgi:hypothetical protein
LVAEKASAIEELLKNKEELVAEVTTLRTLSQSVDEVNRLQEERDSAM